MVINSNSLDTEKQERNLCDDDLRRNGGKYFNLTAEGTIRCLCSI
jgi:hypothetical protein